MNETLMRNALSLRRAGKLAEAAEIYAQVLENEPRHFEALHALGIVRYQTGQLQEAERLIGEAVAVRPEAADANYNRACLLQKMNRGEDALRFFDAAIRLKPDYVEALMNRGSLLAQLNRHAEAIASFDQVAALRPNIAEAWTNRAVTLFALGRAEETVASCDRALALKPVYTEAWKLRGRALAALQREGEALASFDKATTFAPNDAEAWHGRGALLQRQGRLGEALPCFDKALALAPGNFPVRADRASLFFEMERFEDAARDFQALLDADPHCPSYVRGYLTLSKLNLCDWGALDQERPRIAADIRQGLFVLDPVDNAMLSPSAEDQLYCSRTWMAQKFPPAGAVEWQGPRYSHDRIRIAYISADFRTHAVASLIAGVFEHHDKTRFETIGIAYGADDRSPMRARIEGAFEKFLDIRGMKDADVAGEMRRMEIDIAVDLTGYTGVHRTGILARRPAPVQANYLGYPATMGADYIDYIVGDRTVIPPEDAPYYSEKIVWLPDTYQANDSKRAKVWRALSRAEAGLPEGAFVFCCFNNNRKIMPETFDIWMRLLLATENSVLWLLQDNPAVPPNLRREAEARGVSGQRLVFAPRVTPAEHLARQCLADLLLDTLPYNAHTTASDALWAGLPIVTTPGTTFAGRVAASLLEAAELPELIAPSLDAYEALALKLARDRTALSAVKEKIERNRGTCALFDTARITRSLEAAYTRMHERHLAGEPPASFAVDAAGPGAR